MNETKAKTWRKKESTANKKEFPSIKLLYHQYSIFANVLSFIFFKVSEKIKL